MVPAASDGVPPAPPYSGSRLKRSRFRLRDFHPLRRAFPGASATAPASLWRPYYPARAATPTVWAPPLSLATTRGITLVLFSCRYLDVSVRGVRPALPDGARPSAGRVPPFGHPRIQGHLRLPAAFRSLSRPSSPPRATGIPRAPFSFSWYPAHAPARAVLFSSVPQPCHCTLPAFFAQGFHPEASGLPSRRSAPAPPASVVPSGVEPLTPTLSVWCSDQLSYGTLRSAPTAFRKTAKS